MRDVGDMSREAWSAYRRDYAMHGSLSKITALTNVTGESECAVRKSKGLQDYLQHSRMPMGLLLLDKAGRQCHALATRVHSKSFQNVFVERMVTLRPCICIDITTRDSS
jgi:hypothetical protein